MKRYLQTISNYAMVGGLGALLVVGLTGCEKKEEHQNAFSQAQKKQGAFVVIEETSPGVYRIAEEYPSSTTRVILRDVNGTERILSREELDRLVKQEAAKIEQGQSPLVNPQLHSNMSLGEVILASAAGAIIGSWLGNKFFNNPSYQQHRRQTYKSPSVYQRSQNAFKKRSSFSKKSMTTKKSGFFGGGSKTAKKSFFGFGG